MKNLVKWRFFAVMLALIVAAVVILSRYAYHIIIGDSGQGGLSRTSAERGKILDRNGKILASQVTLYNIYVTPPKNEGIADFARELAPLLDMNAEYVTNQLHSAGGNFLLKRNVPAQVMEAIRGEQRNGRLRRVSTVPVSSRIYPEKSLAAQVIGFTGSDNMGREGVEYAFNTELAAGDNITLTLDINVQYILEKVANTTLQETQAEAVMFLAMDPRNGEILGSVVLPGFDPNDYRAYSNDRYLNRTAYEQYEPGSVFKIFTIAALMDSGVINDESEFTCTGVYERIFPSGERVRILCADGRAHGRVRPREIIIYSCNVGAALASDRQENRVFYESIQNFGFGKKTGTWVNMETAGLLKPTNLWSGRTRQSIAFGQEVAVSALQIMQAASIIANNGIQVPPKLISQIITTDGKAAADWESNSSVRTQVIRPETARRILSYMADTATDIGTGWRANIEDLNLAVKTGTSQYRDPVAGGYSRTDFIASCIALLPAESPSMALYVVIIKPRGETYGGRIAAPAIREAAELLIDYLGIPRGRNPIVIHPGIIGLPEELLPPVESTVPPFYGLSKKTLLPLLLRNDIRVEISGEGWVRQQFPLPGTPLTPDTVIELILE
ncbi:MAG: transpeptidase family protein [Treponema sp.]|nr:transpeptidase family protein [Treponema sp.]